MTSTEGNYRGVEAELTDRAVGWAVAVLVACVAGLGLIAVAVLAIFVLNRSTFDLPGWAIQVGGAVLVLAIAAFGWLVATAVERGRNARHQSRGRSQAKQ